MKEKRYFFEGKIEVNKTVTLEGDEFHHLSSVMRTRVGENVCLINGDGNFYFGKVTLLSKKSAEIEVFGSEVSKVEPKVHLTVFQALAKGEKLSLIMQKITELGASELRLFESKFCDVKATSNKDERMTQISISAAKQCGRATIVKSGGVFSVLEVASQIKTFDKFFVAYENEDGHTLMSSLLKLDGAAKNIAVMIGAEGGFDEGEIQLLKSSGAEIVSLGGRILRTETAAISCTALIMQTLERI